MPQLGFYQSDLIDATLEREAIQVVRAQAGEQLDPAFEYAEGVAKRLAADGLRSLHGGRIGHAPMTGDGLARPDRADLAGHLIANGDHKMHQGCARLRELIPTLAAHPFSRKTERAQQTECEGMDLALWETAGAKAPEAVATPMIDEGLCKYAACRIAGAEEQDVITSSLMLRSLLASSKQKPSS